MKSAGLSAFLLVFLTGCTFSLDWFREYRAQRAADNRDFSVALPLLNQLMDTHSEDEVGLRMARQGARVAHLDAKDYSSAVKFYRFIVLRSDNQVERKEAQRAIAHIYFENLQDYDQSVVEFEKLLKLSNTAEEKFRYRLNLAKAQLALNNVGQALTELNVLLDGKPSPEGVYEIKALKANALVANKQMNEATVVWESILKEFPERSRKENVGLNLVVIYEEMKEFDKAIAVLESMRSEYPNPAFLNQRIERLKERRYNMPGAQGLKR